MKNTIVAEPQQSILVLQGGGALGAFQAGVYQALNETGLEPDWAIGTSIGAINAALIAGNRPARRLEALYEFWARVGQGTPDGSLGDPLALAPWARAWTLQWQHWKAMVGGIPGFFDAQWGSAFPLGADVAVQEAGFYRTTPLASTLEELVDFRYLQESPVRLTVGAVDVESGELRYFDSREEVIGVEHVLASGALPPAFPAVAIDGRHYWDGGIHSNTPLERVLADAPRRHSLCFLATLWPLADAAPRSLPDVMRRHKELQYASRAATWVAIEREMHRLRHGIALLASRLPREERRDPDLSAVIECGCRSVYHLVRLQAPRLPDENHQKDLEFDPGRVGARWYAGYADTLRALSARPWSKPVAAEEGILLHDFAPESGDAVPA
jgi:NTE family protein